MWLIFVEKVKQSRPSQFHTAFSITKIHDKFSWIIFLTFVYKFVGLMPQLCHKINVTVLVYFGSLNVIRCENNSWLPCLLLVTKLMLKILSSENLIPHHFENVTYKFLAVHIHTNQRSACLYSEWNLCNCW